MAGLVWYPLVAKCLEPFRAVGIVEFEWATTSVMPEYNLRRVDLVVNIVLPGVWAVAGIVPEVSLPILLVECGKDGLEDKDSMKLHSTMFAVCVHFAHQLALRGKNPELARTFGFLVSRSKAQLGVAHAVCVSTNVPDEFELQANISSSDH